jgi:hypothetical protein
MISWYFTFLRGSYEGMGYLYSENSLLLDKVVHQAWRIGVFSVTYISGFTLLLLVDGN